MSTGVTVAIIMTGMLAAGVGVYFVAKKTRPTSTQIVQSAPTPAVAGIMALGNLAGKGIDAWIAGRASKED
jgi:hypothetical protein